MITLRPAALFLAIAVFVSGSAFGGGDGGDGAVGAQGQAGAAGHAGSIGGLQQMYTWYPLCSLASLIAAGHDEAKLSEYLAAGCSVYEIAAHTRASMFTYTVTRQEPELLSLIAANPRAKAEIDVFAPIPNVDVIENLPVSLNPFELTLYNRLVDTHLPANFPKKPFSSLYVDESQLSMLKLLLSFADDAVKLKTATSTAVQHLKESAYGADANLTSAISLIQDRINELSR